MSKLNEINALVFATAGKMIDTAWLGLKSNWILRQLDVSYNRFHRHPLYRRWAMEAYSRPLAQRAEAVPETVSEILTMITLGLPMAALVVEVLLGRQVFKAVAIIMGGLFALLALVLPVMGLVFSALVAAMPLAQERASGRWELLMISPNERSHVLLMRISSIVYAYRPILVTLDAIQTFISFLMIVVVSAMTRGADDLIVSCFLFFVPVLLILSWERRQDHILSLMLGAYIGLSLDERLVFSRALVGVALVLAMRIMIVLAAFGTASYATEVISIAPAMVGGAAMLPMSGLSFGPGLAFALVYYALREALVVLVWKGILLRMKNI